MKNIFTLLAAVLLTATTQAQVGVGTTTPDASAALDITSTTKGLLPPRMTTGERNLITSAAKGLIVFNTTLNTLQINEGDATTVNWVSLSSTSATYSIGDVVNGGVVFWLDSTGQHGLVVAFSDVATSVEWGCYGTDLPNVPNVPYNGGKPVGSGAEIGDGFNNTYDILQDCPTAPAALAARSLGAQWFLPSAKELNQMYINKTTLEAVSGVTAFATSYYWSSTESVNYYAWAQNLTDGSQVDLGKSTTNNMDMTSPSKVRAIRAF